MILDNEDQRQILLHLINSSTIPGAVLEEALALKIAITNAKVEEGE